MKTKAACIFFGFSSMAICVAMLTACPSVPPVTPLDADVAAPDTSVAIDDAAVVIVDAAPMGTEDSASATPCTKACANLRTLKCPEGAPDAGESCEVVCKHTLAGPFDLKPSCLAAAKTVEAVRACKTVSCPVK